MVILHEVLRDHLRRGEKYFAPTKKIIASKKCFAMFCDSLIRGEPQESGICLPDFRTFSPNQTTLPNKTNGLSKMGHYIKLLLFVSIYSLIYYGFNMA